MPSNQDRLDLAWTYDGDLVIGASGDLQDTSNDTLRSFIQEVQTRVRSALEDWELWPEIGSNLDELRGEINNRQTAQEGQDRIITALTFRGFMKSGDIKVRYVPVTKSRLMYFLNLMVQGTPENNFVEEVRLNLIYDSAEDGIIFTDVIPH